MFKDHALGEEPCLLFHFAERTIHLVSSGYRLAAIEAFRSRSMCPLLFPALTPLS